MKDQLEQLDWAQQEQVVLLARQVQPVLLDPTVLPELEHRAEPVLQDLLVLLVLAGCLEDKVIKVQLVAPDQLAPQVYILQQPLSQELILLSH